MTFFLTFYRFLVGILKALKEPEFRALFFFVILILFSGTVFYSMVEKWSVFNALYFSIVTLLTVGYGDFTPHTDAGKLFTMFYLFVGVGTLLAFVNVVARHSFENSVVFKLKRKSAKKDVR